MHSSLRSLQVFAVFLLTVLSIPALASAAPHWVQATPFGGSMVALAEAPSSPQTLYSATVTGRFFRSLDGGATWGERKSGLPDALIADLFVDPQDSRLVFALTSSTETHAVLRTRNGGLTWTAIGPGVGSVFGLTLDDRRSGVLYAGLQGGLYRSSDAGETWSVIAFADSGAGVFAIAIDPHAPNIFLAAVYKSDEGMTFWRSADQGATWTASSTLPPGVGPGVKRIVFDPAHAGTAYAFLGPQGDHGTTFRTTDGGVTWSLLTATVGLRDLVPSPDGTLFAAADFGIARSNDLGETWTPPLPALLTAETAPRDILSRLIVSPAAPGTLFAAGDEGIWKSADDGGSWMAVNRGIGALQVISLAAAPAGPDNLVAVAAEEIFRSPDQGDTWQLVHSVLDGAQPLTIEAFDPHNPQTLYGIGFDGQASFLAKSSNGGDDWRRLQDGYTCSGDSICDIEISAFALDPRKTNNLFLGIVSFIHFQGLTEHILSSADGGKTWKELTFLHDLQDLVADPRQGRILYGLTCQGIFKSENTGSVWTRIGSGLPGEAPALCSTAPGQRKRLAIDSRQPQTFYVGTARQGVFRSTDGGVTFRPFNRGLETADVTTILVDPTNSSNLYALATGKGVWRWNAQQSRWTPLNTGLPVWDFNAGALALDPQHPSVLYAGTQTHGVYRLDP